MGDERIVKGITHELEQLVFGVMG